MISEEKIIITKSDKETQKLGFEFSKKITHPAVICLYGNLGSGKTTFTKGFAKGLGIKERIISPTFMLVRQHKGKDKIIFYHVDLYRLNSKQEIKNLGLDEVFEDKNGIVVVEWAERIKDEKPKKRWDICFEHLKEKTRKITFAKIG